jgi:FAD:protein FMN transferase
MQQGGFRAMGSNVSWWGERDVSRELMALFERVEACCSRFREESELSRINKDPTRSVTVSPLLAEMLVTADRAHHLSAGKVDPTVLPAVRAAGYDKDLAAATKKVGGSTPVPGWGSVSFDSQSLDRPPGTEIDLGGIAKGWTARAALDIQGALLVDAAGDIAARGRWTVAVEHGGASVAGLIVEDCGVATSGVDRRSWANGHHLIDPATGSPAVTDVLAATVVAGDLTVAETVARTVVLMGAWNGLGWAEALSDVQGALVTTVDGVTLSFPRTRGMLT